MCNNADQFGLVWASSARLIYNGFTAARPQTDPYVLGISQPHTLFIPYSDNALTDSQQKPICLIRSNLF